MLKYQQELKTELKVHNILDTKGRRVSNWKSRLNFFKTFSKNLQLYNDYFSQFNNEQEAWYCLIHDDDPENHRCEICNKLAKFSSKQLYTSTCGSRECIEALKEKDKDLDTWRLNVKKTWASKSKEELKEITNKTKNTCLERYDVENPLQSKEIQEKIQKTTLNRYGESHFSKTQEYRDKYKATCLKRYGVEHPLKTSEIVDKIKATSLEKYGTLSYSGTNECKEKVKRSFHNHYSVDNISQSEYWKEKCKQTSLEHYGTEFVMQAEEVKEKVKNTCLDKYGVGCVLQADSVKEKIKETLKKRYGVDHNFKILGFYERQNKAKQDHILRIEKENNVTFTKRLVKRYGVGWIQAHIVELISYPKFKGFKFVKNKDIPRIKEYADAHVWSGTSHSEKEIVEFVRSIYDGEVIENTRRVISPYELDIYIPEKNLAIEFNGSYWHSQQAGEDKNYHELKSLLCEEKGIRLIHIYECEWEYHRDKIESLLRLALGIDYKRIGARQCEVRQITNKEAKPFNDKNHLQNHRNAYVTYGLFYEGELQQLMSFSHHHKYEWEIIRGCPGSNNQVVGGVSKLFKAFVRDYNPNSVFSYCDFNKFDGKGYLSLSMEFIGYTGPDKFYVDCSGAKVMRDPKRRHELEETCLIIFGAGSKKYLWKSN